MHRTLFSPAMIETFRTCRRAYDLAFLKEAIGENPQRLTVICKHFILRGLAQINKGKVTSIAQVQKYMGLNWPADRVSAVAIDKDDAAKAFLFVYKTLLGYVTKPYLHLPNPPNSSRYSKVVGCALKVRARVPQVRVYLEDTLDLVLWYPNERKLEFIDFHIQPIKAFDPAWPSVDLLVKKFLAERLQTRWPFTQLSIVSQRLGVTEFLPVNLNLEETIYRLHWQEIVKQLEKIKGFENSDPKDYGLNPHIGCHLCETLERRLPQTTETDFADACLSA